MPKSESLDVLIARKAGEFAVQVRSRPVSPRRKRKSASRSENQLAFIQEGSRYELEGRHEFTLAKGRVDSVYSRV